jgi:uncharacterized protein YndB with AHSA1/START domain
MPDFVATGEVAKVDDEERLVFGWAYIDRDSSGNFVNDISKQNAPIHEVEKAAYPFVLTSRTGGEMHRRNVAKLVESVVFTPEKIEQMGISGAPQGWWVGFKVEDDDAWEGVKSGRLAMFSIGGSGKKRPALAA